MESIAVILPVYEKPKRVARIVETLLSCGYGALRIIVVVDGFRNDAIDAALEPFAAAIEILYNDERRGKSASLMRAASGKPGELLLFIDNDVVLPPDTSFLDKFAASMKDADIMDFPKEALGKGIFPRMMRYEFLVSAMTEFVLAKISRRCPAVMGAILGVRGEFFARLGGFRNIVCEDLDLGARAFQNHARFAFDPRLLVRTEVPETGAGWVHQRKRWAVGNIVWFNEHFLMILRHGFRSFRFFLSALALFTPSLVFFLIFVAFRSMRFGHILPLVYLLIDRYNIVAGMFFWLSHWNTIVIDGILPILIGLGASELIFFVAARFLGFRFNPLDFLLFYFVYSPLVVLANVVAWFLVRFKVSIGYDWKV